MIEANEKKSREPNLILHGVPESGSTNVDDRKKHEQEFVADLFQELGLVDVAYKALYRLGKPNQTQKRPLKLVIEDIKGKERIMSNLKKLKDKEKFIGVSITDDYTPSERKLIKDKVEEAKVKNKQESLNSNYVWKVRGNPKNGLILKRFQKRAPITQQ